MPDANAKLTWAVLSGGGFAIAWFLTFLVLSREVGTAVVGAVVGGVVFFALALVLPGRRR